MLLDISQPVSPRTAVFPGDQPFECSWTLRLERGESVNLSAIRSSPHVGTHVDAPLHYDPDGAGVDALPLDAFLGPCVVVRVPDGAGLVTPEHLRGVDLQRAERVLFRTRARSHPERWDPGFTALAPEAARLLGEAGVRLVGIDTPSVDPADSKTLDAHHALGRAGIPNLENLLLDHVAPGAYELIALPARYEGMDAAPVRAALRLLRPG